jgi:chromosome segregation and condensation protein ScpB
MVIQKKIVEAILFSAPEAFSVQQIAKISDMDVGEAKKIIDELI